MPETTLQKKAPTSPFAPKVVPLPSAARAIEEMENRIRHFFTDPFTKFLPEQVGYFPAAEMSETKDAYTVTVELPGLMPKDVTLDFDAGVLAIRGEKEEEKEKEKNGGRRFYLYERSYGAFYRTFAFPGLVQKEKISATFKDGVLMVHLPKTTEEKGRTTKIEIAEAK